LRSSPFLGPKPSRKYSKTQKPPNKVEKGASSIPILASKRHCWSLCAQDDKVIGAVGSWPPAFAAIVWLFHGCKDAQDSNLPRVRGGTFLLLLWCGKPKGSWSSSSSKIGCKAAGLLHSLPLCTGFVGIFDCVGLTSGLCPLGVIKRNVFSYWNVITGWMFVCAPRYSARSNAASSKVHPVLDDDPFCPWSFAKLCRQYVRPNLTQSSQNWFPSLPRFCVRNPSNSKLGEICKVKTAQTSREWKFHSFETQQVWAQNGLCVVSLTSQN
jgi:hypothetical protein